MLIKKTMRRSLVRMSYIALLFVFLIPGTSAQSVSKPESVGMSSERLRRLDHLIETYVNEKELAGAVTLVAKDGRIVNLHASGFQDLESKTPMRTDSLFRMYSMTKPITSVAFLMLYEQGYFQLDDPLELYIPAFKDVKVFERLDDDGNMVLVKPERKITIRDVFTHTGGISYGNDNHPVDKAYRAAGIAYFTESLKDMVGKIATMPLRFQPGTRWHYSYSLDVIAYLVEHFSGMPFDQYLQKNIFKPLGMKDTSFGVSAAKLDRLTSMYSPPGYKGVPPFATQMTVGLERLESATDSGYLKAGAYPAGGSGLISTAEDYFRFAQMLVNGGEYNGVRLLSPKTVSLMASAHVPMGFPGIPDLLLKGSGYGLGVSVMVDTTAQGNLGSNGQFGWSGAASTHVIMDPKEHMVSILLAQYRPALLPLQKRFQTLVYQALTGPP